MFACSARTHQIACVSKARAFPDLKARSVSSVCAGLLRIGVRKGDQCGALSKYGNFCGRPEQGTRGKTQMSLPSPCLSTSKLSKIAHALEQGSPKKRVCTAQLILRNVSTSPSTILLGRHGVDGFFPGRLTGLCASLIGAGVQPEDTLVEAAAKHGLVLRPEVLERRAVFEFLESDEKGVVNEDWVCYAEVESIPRLQATEAWDPRWVPCDAIPYCEMPVDDAVWYPPFLEGMCLGGRFSFSGRRLISCAMWELSKTELKRMRRCAPARC